MAATPYKPISWSDRSVSQEKLQQMANNDQWLFENSPRMRYSVAGNVRDSGIKIIAGKTSYGPTNGPDYEDVNIYFGNFFSAACKPVVTSTVGVDIASGLRKYIVNRGFGGEIDYRGFIAHVTAHEPPGYSASIPGGWLHWIAVGF